MEKKVQGMRGQYEELLADSRASTGEVLAQLGRVKDFESNLGDLMEWLTEKEAVLAVELDQLNLQDSSVIEQLVQQLEVSALCKVKQTLWAIYFLTYHM